jgi:hypothetical protein
VYGTLPYLSNGKSRKMASSFVDISLLGDKELEKALRKLPDKAEVKAVRPALRKSTKRLHVLVIQAWSGVPMGVRTGRTLTAWVAQKVHAIPRKGGWIGAAFDWPSREALGISADDEWYHPAVSEYGSPDDPERYPAYAPIRSTVNRVENRELATIGRDTAKGIERQWAQLAKRR